MTLFDRIVTSGSHTFHAWLNPATSLLTCTVKGGMVRGVRTFANEYVPRKSTDSEVLASRDDLMARCALAYGCVLPAKVA